MKKMIHKLLLCLTAFTITFSTFGGSVALASSNSYYKPNKSVHTSSGVQIHKNNFPTKATTITYTMYINGKAIGTRDIKKQTAWLSSNAEDSITMIAGKNLVKEKQNTVKVKACYRNGFNYKEYNCKEASASGLTGKKVDQKTFKLIVDKKGNAKLKY